VGAKALALGADAELGAIATGADADAGDSVLVAVLAVGASVGGVALSLNHVSHVVGVAAWDEVVGVDALTTVAGVSDLGWEGVSVDEPVGNP
jgi:hypothetical protein